MKKLQNLLFLLALLTTVSFISCKEDSEDDPAQIMRDYLVENAMDIDHVLTSADGKKFVFAAPDDGDLSAYLVLDLRSATDFAAGHISGAINTTLTDMFADAASATKPIAVVCYTGQTACYATALLRLYGFQDAQALKWGMSGWNTEFDKWTAGVSNIADGHANWSMDATAPADATKGWPTFTAAGNDGLAILKARVEVVASEGFKGVAGSDVLNDPDGYFINNYFSETDYAAFGHIDGAHRILPLLVSDGTVSQLDPSEMVVTYCYTGQTSAVVTAYLRVLGYDAYSMKFGMNGVYNSNSAWTVNQWGGDSNPKNLSYE